MKIQRTIILFLVLIFSSLGLQAQSKDSLSYPYPVKKVALGDSLAIAYIDVGKGSNTLIFIHGLGSYLPAWQLNIDTLKANNRCIALDLPGYGKSSKGDFAYNMTFFANTIKGFMEKMSIEKATIIGHSMGGQIAMTFAINHPEKVNRLILIAPAGFETFKPDQAKLLESFTTPEQIKNTPDQKIRSNLEMNFSKMPPKAEFMVSDRIKMKQQTDFSNYSKATSKSVKGMLDEPVFDKLSEIKASTLIIFGKDDKLIPNKFFNSKLSTAFVGEAGKEKIANSQLYIIEDAGHMVNFEKAKEVNKLIIDFLKVK
jgi:pimeloyl-ACP methyl ester carboxylesterase